MGGEAGIVIGIMARLRSSSSRLEELAPVWKAVGSHVCLGAELVETMDRQHSRPVYPAP